MVTNMFVITSDLEKYQFLNMHNYALCTYTRFSQVQSHILHSLFPVFLHCAPNAMQYAHDYFVKTINPVTPEMILAVLDHFLIVR